jgi:aryl-alcohol dehydrogenase-like predicted oxidoreductase
MTPAPRLLSDGSLVPPIIKGGWQLAERHGEEQIDEARAIRDMFLFAEAGVSAFDCADIYAGVEYLIGRFLKEWRTTHPSQRDTLRVHTKYVPDLAALASLSFTDVERAIDRSRSRLGLDELHLVQFHWWDFEVPGFRAVAEHLMALRERGAVRAIGLTNCDMAHLGELRDAGIQVVSHQVQYSLLDRRPAGAHAETCATNNVALFAYGALAGSFLAERWLGTAPPSEPLENRSLVKYRMIIDEFGGWDLYQELLGALYETGKRYGVGAGTVAIRWVLDQPQVMSVIAGARSAAHLEGTLAALSLVLDDEDRQCLLDVLGKSTGPRGDVYGLERQKSGKHAVVMRYNQNAGS